MNTILKQVSKARWRLFVSRFFKTLVWSLFAFLILAAIAVAIPRIWHLSIGSEFVVAQWDWLVIGVAAISALVLTTVISLLGRESNAQAAVEIDQRFRLKDRLTSALMLNPDVAATSEGQALIEDAESKAELIDVRDEFPFRTSWLAAIPILPAAVLGALILLPLAEAKVTDAAPTKTVIDKKEVKIAVETAKKKLKKRAEKMTETGLKDALKGMETINNKIDKIASGSEEAKKDALSKINDIKKQLSERQRELGGSKALKKTFGQLGKANEGPAKKITEAMKKGDLKAARDAVKDLAKKLRDGKLSEAEKKKLANDINQLAKEMKKIAERREQAKRDLQNQIQQARDKGDLDKAAKMQQELEQMKAQDKQAEKMKKMADKLQKAADAMKKAQQQAQQKGGQKGQQGDSNSKPGQKKDGQGMEDAAQALEDISQQMEQMEQDLEELQDLEDLQDEMDDLKAQMQGMPGDGQGDKPNWQDWAGGKGRGGGKRPDSETDTGNYESKVEGKLQKGRVVKTGSADGANLKGGSVQSAREAVTTAMGMETDPLENQKLPRSVREHASQYFENFRKGN